MLSVDWDLMNFAFYYYLGVVDANGPLDFGGVHNRIDSLHVWRRAHWYCRVTLEQGPYNKVLHENNTILTTTPTTTPPPGLDCLGEDCIVAPPLKSLSLRKC